VTSVIDSSGILIVGRGPKLGDDAVGDKAAVEVGEKFGDMAAIDVGGKFGDMACVDACAVSMREGVILGDDTVVVTGVVAKRVGKSGDEDRGTPGGASGAKTAGQMASAPSSTWS
jgi:hypothetical protein